MTVREARTADIESRYAWWRLAVSLIRQHFSPAEAGGRVGMVLMATLFGMALGGWMSGAIFDATGSYRAAFINGIGWNLLNMVIVSFLLWSASRSMRAAPSAYTSARA